MDNVILTVVYRQCRQVWTVLFSLSCTRGVDRYGQCYFDCRVQAV